VRRRSPQARERYLALAVLLEDMPIHPTIQQVLWNADEGDCLETADQFVSLSLAQRDEDGGGIRLHDLQYDYIRAQYGDRERLKLIHGAVRLSSHVIARDPWQFVSQLVGRLLAYKDQPAIRRFTSSLVKAARRPWLRARWPTLHPSGTALIRILEGHHLLNGVALSADGRAVSASSYSTLKVWDLETGCELRTLEGHSGSVFGVAVSADGRRAVSASYDKTLKVWDLETGCELHTLEGHSSLVNCVAVAADGQRAVSASADHTLKVWDLETGQQLRTLRGHSKPVSGVAVSADGRRAVSSSMDNTLKLWDLVSGRQLRTVRSHANGVTCVAMTADGRRAISASYDGTLKVWDLKTARQLGTLQGHSKSVSGVAVSADGRRAVSASYDKTLKFWDLETAKAVATFTADAALRCCAFASTQTILAGDNGGHVHFLKLEE
jgi:hypothetical protein